MESKELKSGDTATYEIAGKKVVLKPVTLGRMKKAMEAFKDKDGDTFEMMQKHLLEILTNSDNDFMSLDWIADNVTMPIATQIVNDMRIINGLERNNFFQEGVPKAEPRESRDLSGQATPSV